MNTMAEKKYPQFRKLRFQADTSKEFIEEYRCYAESYGYTGNNKLTHFVNDYLYFYIKFPQVINNAYDYILSQNTNIQIPNNKKKFNGFVMYANQTMFNNLKEIANRDRRPLKLEFTYFLEKLYLLAKYQSSFFKTSNYLSYFIKTYEIKNINISKNDLSNIRNSAYIVEYYNVISLFKQGNEIEINCNDLACLLFLYPKNDNYKYKLNISTKLKKLNNITRLNIMADYSNLPLIELSLKSS